MNKLTIDPDIEDWYCNGDNVERTRKRLIQISEMGLEVVGYGQFGYKGIMSGLYIEMVWSYSEEDWGSYVDWAHKLIIEKTTKVMTIQEIFENKFAPVLNQWCIHFKIIGFPNETPRYSQIYINSDRSLPAKFRLQSTQKDIHYPVDLTDEETKIVNTLHEDLELWNAWKKFRTEFLIKNHPTIKPN